jgi:type IV secretory pathway TrbD component
MAGDYRRFDSRDPSLGALIGELIADAQDLIRGEVALAKQELKEEARAAGTGLGLMVGAAALGLVGAIFVGFTLTYALALVLDLWLAALIVAGIYLIGAFILFTLGKRHLQRVAPVPRRTIESLKEDRAWVKQQISSDRS